MKKETQALVIADAQKDALTTFTGKMFTDLDFQGLEQIIDKIVESGNEMTDGMRIAATSYAEQWRRLVIEKLDLKKARLERLLKFFEEKRPNLNTIKFYDQSWSHWNGHDSINCEPILPAILNVLQSNKTWAKYAQQYEDIYEKLQEIDEETENAEPDREEYLFEEDNMTYNERCLVTRKYEYDHTKWYADRSQRFFEIRKEFVNVHLKLLAEPGIKDFIKAVEYQIKNSQRAYTVANEKAALVSMSINFGNTSILSALQELHEFQKTI